VDTSPAKQKDQQPAPDVTPHHHLRKALIQEARTLSIIEVGRAWVTFTSLYVASSNEQDMKAV
jgi:hypothetical protein